MVSNLQGQHIAYTVPFLWTNPNDTTTSPVWWTSRLGMAAQSEVPPEPHPLTVQFLLGSIGVNPLLISVGVL